jgi:hypothetical protein
MTDETTNDPGCGCCRPEAKTKDDVVRELQARRDDLERRLQRLEHRQLVSAR